MSISTKIFQEFFPTFWLEGSMTGIRNVSAHAQFVVLLFLVLISFMCFNQLPLYLQVITSRRKESRLVDFSGKYPRTGVYPFVEYPSNYFVRFLRVGEKRIVHSNFHISSNSFRQRHVKASSRRWRVTVPCQPETFSTGSV